MGKGNKGGRPQVVSIYLVGKVWNIRFNNLYGKVTRKSLKTKIESEALSMKKQIEWLAIDPDCKLVTNSAYELFFGQPKANIDSTENDLKVADEENDADELLEYKAQEYIRIIADLRQKLATALPFETMYKTMIKTREGKLLLSADTLPTVREALAEYKILLSHIKYTSVAVNFVTRFFETPESGGFDRKIDFVTAIEIQRYLSRESDTAQSWHRKRQFFTQFYNRIEKIYVFENPMPSVMDKKPEHKPDIHFHKLAQVNKFLKGLKTDYEKALFSTLFFTGVTASEFRGLRVCDYFEIDGQWVIRVTPTDFRSIKRAKRRRNINVGKRLKEALDTYLKGHKGGTVLFPRLSDGKHYTKRSFTYYTAAIFPADMNCMSTRRTYGSLLIRQGVSGTEVAATMGNSLLMVDQHYGRIKAQEVKALDI